MVSLIEELRRREAAARAEADLLRARIEELSGALARAEEQVTRLAITRRCGPVIGKRQVEESVVNAAVAVQLLKPAHAVRCLDELDEFRALGPAPVAETIG